MLTCFDCNGFELPEVCAKLKKIRNEDDPACYAFRDAITKLTRDGKQAHPDGHIRNIEKLQEVRLCII